MPSAPGFTTLGAMRDQALASARAEPDPLTAQQYRDLARCYEAALRDLETTGATIVPAFDPDTIPWRSIPLSTPRKG